MHTEEIHMFNTQGGERNQTTWNDELNECTAESSSHWVSKESSLTYYIYI